MTTDKNNLENLIASAKEPELEDHQHQWEAAILATLAGHVNGEQSDLKYLILGRLHADDLQRSDHRAIYQAMKALHDQGEGIDVTTVKDWLKTNVPVQAPAVGQHPARQARRDDDSGDAEAQRACGLPVD